MCSVNQGTGAGGADVHALLRSHSPRIKIAITFSRFKESIILEFEGLTVSVTRLWTGVDKAPYTENSLAQK
jgi:hypothetical protein